MEYRPLKINVISADGIKNVKIFSKMDVYAQVSIAGYPQSTKKTFVDKNSGTSPKWNHRMEFIVDEPYLTKPGLSLLFQLMAESTFRSHKEIGSVIVPIHELFKPDSTEDKQVEYQLRIPSGKPKGSIRFSYSFGEKFSHKVEAKRHADEPVMAYPPAPYAAAPHMGMGYTPPPPAPGYGAHPQSSGYGYQAPPPWYGYQAPPPWYGQAQKPKKNKMGFGGGGGGGLGLGLGAGLLGGLLVGDMVSDFGESAAYVDGYGDAMDDMEW